MQKIQINSKHNGHSQGGHVRQNDDWRKQLNSGREKLNHKNNFEKFYSNGTGQPPLGKITVLLTLFILGGSFVEGKPNTSTKEGHLDNSNDYKSVLPSGNSACVKSVDAVENGLAFLTLKQLIDAKVKIDPTIPEKFHKDLQCDKVRDQLRKTAEIFPASGARIERVLRQPESKTLCSTRKRMNEFVGSDSTMAFFVPTEGAIYFAGDETVSSRIISHEFIHADCFFRNVRSPFDGQGQNVDNFLPFYPPSEKNIAQYKQALDKGDKRIDDYYLLRRKSLKKERLSPAQKDRLKNYEAAAKDCLNDGALTKVQFPPDSYNDFLDAGWKPGKKGIILREEDLMNIEIIDVERTKKGTLLTFKPADIGGVVSMTTMKVRGVLKQDNYRDLPENHKLAERDAHTFEHLSENAINVFYPEAYAIRMHNPDRNSI